MTRLCLDLAVIEESDAMLVGGKALSLARLMKGGFFVPDGLSVTTTAYESFVARTGLRERILLELNRKAFHQMRWEELWDASLRLRNMFLQNPMPQDLAEGLREAIGDRFAERPAVVRSSAPGEDSAAASFAGLHESYVNVQGVEEILDHVRLVWASLWSDRALLYRQELGLDVDRNAMAVLIQDFVPGDRSGVAFSESSQDRSQAIIEAVHGLNQGFVDGLVEPDSWVIDRDSESVISHRAPERDKRMVASSRRVRLVSLPKAMRRQSPLDERQLRSVLSLALRSEQLFGSPQDVEWTFDGDLLYILQSRPITTRLAAEGDQRPWYLSLHRSYENLKRLRERIETLLIPAMIEESDALEAMDLDALDDGDLAKEVMRRAKLHEKWLEVYWKEFIPFAHGTRLFGQVYNDVMRPEDPFAFVDLLVDDSLLSIRRNKAIEDLAVLLREVMFLKTGEEQLARQRIGDSVNDRINAIVSEYGSLLGFNAMDSDQKQSLLNLAQKIAQSGGRRVESVPSANAALEEEFLSRFADEEKAFAEDLLSLARASYRLRDDDNIFLDRIERQKDRAMLEAKKRMARRSGLDQADAAMNETLANAADLSSRPTESNPQWRQPEVRDRQITGQPCSPGVAHGPARIIRNPADAFDFRSGEILVCDAIHPNMTFVVPLAAGIIERRGGMLIHGAIVAREYGLPCVTGIPDATSRIRTGDRVTVDGYLGIVLIHSTGSRQERQ